MLYWVLGLHVIFLGGKGHVSLFPPRVLHGFAHAGTIPVHLGWMQEQTSSPSHRVCAVLSPCVPPLPAPGLGGARKIGTREDTSHAAAVDVGGESRGRVAAAGNRCVAPTLKPFLQVNPTDTLELGKLNFRKERKTHFKSAQRPVNSTFGTLSPGLLQFANSKSVSRLDL